MYPGRTGNTSVAGGAARPTFAYHSKSTSGQTVHASAGTDALASAATANPAEISLWVSVMFDSRARCADDMSSGYFRAGTVSASRARFLGSVRADIERARAQKKMPAFGAPAFGMVQPLSEA